MTSSKFILGSALVTGTLDTLRYNGRVMPNRSEEWAQVLEELGRGNRVAFARVTRLIMSLLARLRLYDLQAHWDDIAQEVMVQILKNIRAGAIRDPKRFVSFCATVTRRESSLWLRKHRQQRDRTSGVSPEEKAAPPMRTDDPDLRLQMARALDRLDEKSRQVMELIYLRGHTYEEAALRLGMPLGTLKRTQTQALRELREKLGIDS